MSGSVAVISEKPSERKATWVYAVLPINVASGPVGTLVALYILTVLHGTVIDVGIATTLFSAVTIPAAVLWGIVTDRFHRRAPIIAASYFAGAASLILFLFVDSILAADALYVFFSVVSSAAATPLNLLIMETQPKPRWASAFARLSFVSGIGLTIGLLLSVAWSDFLSLQLLAVPLALLSVSSGVLAVVTIREPSYTFEREVIVMNRRSFLERFLNLPLMFIKIPRIADFNRVFQGLRNELTRQLPILYLSVFVFYLAAGIFNTSLVPSLYIAGVSKSQVFLVTLVAMIVQTAAFRYVGPYVEKRTLRTTAVSGLLLRSISYIMIGVSVLFATGLSYLGSALIFFPLGAGVAYAAYYTASNVMVFNSLGHQSQGSTLGVYSALVGVGTTVGSLVSGFTSFYLGYFVTFILAGLFLVISAWLTSLLQRQPKEAS